MLFHRQKLLLGLLEALGGEIRNTDFQKLLFMFTTEEEEPSYEFVPYKFGCFSFTSYADRRKLVERGYLKDDENSWILNKSVQLAEVTRRKVKKFAYNNRELRGDELIRKVYTSHPETAWRSTILDRIVPNSPDRDMIESARPARKGPGLTTIGYEGKSLEAYLNTLLLDGATLLCDVRRNPLSRKYGFSKKALAHGCEGVDIKYVHMPELGIPSDQRQELNTQADYDRLFEDYAANALPLQGRAIQTIIAWIKAGERVALTCYEMHPHQCHRHCVAKEVEANFGGMVDLVHL